jgi:anti-sigma B factor antagonist
MDTDISVKTPRAGSVVRIARFPGRCSNAGADIAAVDQGEIAIRVVHTSSESTVTVTGRVTVESSPRLRSVLLQLLRQGAGPVVVIELSEVSYLDTSGIATLLEALKAAHQRSVKLRVSGITGQSRTLAEVAELDRIFQTAGSQVDFR